MSFGKRLTDARKIRGLSQEEVAVSLNTKAPVIGRYERNESKPSIEVAAKLSELLDVSLDHLVGNSTQEIDKIILNRVSEIQELPKEEQEKIFYFVDMAIRDYKAKQAYS